MHSDCIYIEIPIYNKDGVVEGATAPAKSVI